MLSCGGSTVLQQQLCNKERPMLLDVVGWWRLVAWRRIVQGAETTYPLGEGATGFIFYAPDGNMAVQMLAADRSSISTSDALGGTEAERAAAYSGCLAYFGRYAVEGNSVTHWVAGSLFPNWSGTTQVRPAELRGDQLFLRTPPQPGPTGAVINEIEWTRSTDSGSYAAD
jgi:hypothetical protein